MRKACHYGRKSRLAVATMARERSAVSHLGLQLLRALLVYTTWVLLVAGAARLAGAATGGESGPIVAIVQPSYNDQVKGLTQVLITVEPRKFTPQTIEMFVDSSSATGGPLRMDALTLPSAAFNWDTKLYTDGLHKLTVKVTDVQGFIGQSEVTVYINNKKLPDTTAPVIAWVGLQANTQLHGVVTMNLKVADDFGVKWLVASVRAKSSPNKDLLQWFRNLPPYTFNFDTTKLADGDYLFGATAWDGHENEGEAPLVPFTINNLAANMHTLSQMTNPTVAISKEPSTAGATGSPAGATGAAPRNDYNVLPVPAEKNVPAPTVAVPDNAVANPTPLVNSQPAPASQPSPPTQNTDPNAARPLIAEVERPASPSGQTTQQATSRQGARTDDATYAGATRIESGPAPMKVLPPSMPSERTLSAPRTNPVKSTGSVAVSQPARGPLVADVAPLPAPRRVEIAPGTPTMARSQDTGVRSNPGASLPTIERYARRPQVSQPDNPRRTMPAGDDALTYAATMPHESAAVDVIQPGSATVDTSGQRGARLTAPAGTSRILLDPATPSLFTNPDTEAVASQLPPPIGVFDRLVPLARIAVPEAPSHLSASTSLTRSLTARDPLALLAEVITLEPGTVSLQPTVPDATVRAMPVQPLAPAQASSVFGLSGSAMSHAAPVRTDALAPLFMARLQPPAGLPRHEPRVAAIDATSGGATTSSMITGAQVLPVTPPVAPSRATVAAAPSGTLRPVYRGVAQPSTARTMGANSMATGPGSVPQASVQRQRVASATQPTGSSRTAYSVVPKVSPVGVASGSIMSNPAGAPSAARNTSHQPRTSLPHVVMLPPQPAPHTASMAPIKVAPITLATAIPASYVTRRDETIRSIAARYALSPQLLATTNNLRPGAMLRAGTTVQLPRPLLVTYQGQPVKGDVGSLLVGSTAVTPFRHLFERQGGVLMWDAAHQRVTARNATHEVTLQIGSRTAIVNHKEQMMDLAAFLLSGRTMVPLRFFETGLHAQVEWEPATGRIYMAMSN